jgi:hypothetical protein
MAGALVVIVLAGLLLPISMLLTAVVIDLLVVAWAVEEVTRRDVWPRLKTFADAHHLGFHLPHAGARHH